MICKPYLLVVVSTWVILSQTQATSIHLCNSEEGLHLEGSAAVVPEGPKGEKVLKADGKFTGRIDLKPLGLNPRKFDLLKFEIKTPRGAFVRLSLENYPNEGELSHWYVCDGTRGPSDWKTIWIDLRHIEEVKPPGKYKGMSAKDPSLRGLQLLGQIVDSRRSIQEPGTSMWIRNIRFANQDIQLDWNQIDFEQDWGKGKDLTYTYPVTVTNNLNKPVSVDLSLQPVDVIHAKASLSVTTFQLAPKSTRQVKASVSLPAKVAANAKPLYCERFEARAVATNVPDSEVTILQSADPIHLNVTVPIPEEKLQLPFYPKLKSLPEWVFNGWDEEIAREKAAAISPPNAKAVVEAAVRKFGTPEGGTLHSGINSAAMLYSITGDKQYLESLRQIFRAMGDVYTRLKSEDDKKEYRLVSDGLMAVNVLQFCFKFGGGQRPPYYYSLSGNGANGSLFGHMHAFDAIAADLSKEDRDYIIQKLFLPMMVQVRNHYFGLGNQQSNSNTVVLYSALLTRHWPSAGFAHTSEHGILGNLKWTFDDDGLCREGHYQEYTINPILHATEALYGRGIDLYDERLYNIVRSKGADAIGQGYRYDFKDFLDQHRFAGKPFLTNKKSGQDGYHLSASTLLKWGELEVCMNWGTHIFRGSRDRCTLSIRTPRKGSDRELRKLACGGGAYNHSTFGQSTIIINEEVQNSVPAKILSYDIEGPVQHVTSVSEDHFPGSRVSRTFVLLERSVMVIDRIRCEKPSTVDWYLGSAGNKLSVPLESVEGSWTTKKYDNRKGLYYGAEVTSHQFARTSENWSEGSGRMTMLGGPDTEIRTWKGRSRPQMLVRRKDVTETDFVSYFSLEPATLERGNATNGGVGIKVKLESGKVFHVLLNHSRGIASYAGLRTRKTFATDYQ